MQSEHHRYVICYVCSQKIRKLKELTRFASEIVCKHCLENLKQDIEDKPTVGGNK